MARRRDHAREYRARIARGEARGLSRTAARGHGRTPERPSRAIDNPDRYPEWLQRHPGAVAALNARREREGKTRIEIGYPPSAGFGARQFTFDRLEDADRHIDWATALAPEYKTIYLSPEGWTTSILARKSRRRAA